MQKSETMTEKTTFANLAVRLQEIIDSIPVIKKPLNAIFNVYAEWGSEEHPEVTEILVAAFKLLESQPAKRSETHIKDIEELLDEHLHHKYARFEYSREIFERDDFFENHHIEEVYYAYDYCAKGLLERLKVLAGEYPNASLEDTTIETDIEKLKWLPPDKQKALIAKSIGRANSLDVFVSDWKRDHGEDLPWVIRKSNLSWLPDIEKFMQWRTTTEGKKRGPGRPRKKAGRK